MIRDTAAQDRKLRPSVARRAARWVWLVVPLCIAIGAVFGLRAWLSGEHSIDADKVRVSTVRRGTLVRDIATDGRVTAANSPTLYAPTAGTVDLLAAAGDEVKRGQAVATIASPELESRLVQERATRDQLSADVGRFGLRVEQASARAQSLVDQAKIDHQTAKRELEQNAEGFKHGAVPEITMLRAKDSLTKAEISLAHARENLGLEKRGLEFERKSTSLQLRRQEEVVKDLERQVAALTVRSPADGVVGQVAASQRAEVGLHAPLMTVVDLSALELEIKVPESFARDLAVSMPAEIDVRGDKVVGKVRSVSPQVVNGVVAARIGFVGSPPQGLRQNQRLSTRVLIDERANVLLVDRGPSVDASGGYVYFVVGGVAERRPVRIGASGLKDVEIVSGAGEGDRVVVSGAEDFGEAARVRLTD